MLGGKRLKSPSGFQSERCHQHMCSRHVGGGGSINEGASLSDLLRHPAHSGNFISHNRTLKPPFHTSFTPTADPPSASLRLFRPRLSFFLRFFRRGRVLSSFRPARLFGNSPPSPPVSAFTSIHPSSFRRSFATLFPESDLSLFSSSSLSPLSHTSNAHQRQYLTALTVG